MEKESYEAKKTIYEAIIKCIVRFYDGSKHAQQSTGNDDASAC